MAATQQAQDGLRHSRNPSAPFATGWVSLRSTHPTGLLKLGFSMLQPYQLLPEIFSPVKLGDSSRAMFDAVGNLFAVTELSVADPFGETLDRLHVAVLII